MKYIVFCLLSLSLLLACSKDKAIELVGVSDTGCARENPVTRSGEGAASQLILEFTAEGLVVTRTNALMNCSVKNGGVVCDVTSKGSTIYCEVYEKDGKSMRCTCPVESITSTIKGLQSGREYTLMYSCDGTFSPVSFTYGKNLRMVLEADLYRQSGD